jgi:hypothetical protein
MSATDRRQAMLLAVWGLAAIPFLWMAAFWTFVLRARVALGEWPAPYRPDPKDLGFDIHYVLLVAGMPLALAAAIVAPALLLRPRAEGRSRRQIAAALLALAGGAILIAWGQIDPGSFLYWFGD